MMTVIVCHEDGTVAERWSNFRCDGEAYSTYNGRLLEYRRDDRGLFDPPHTVTLYGHDGAVLQLA